jgi:hypothetical protein
MREMGLFYYGLRRVATVLTSVFSLFPEVMVLKTEITSIQGEGIWATGRSRVN